jgi:hypothetical protein
MVVPECIFERALRFAKCSFRSTEIAGSCIQGGEIRQRRWCLEILFSEATAISTQNTTQKCPRLAQSSEVNQDGKRRDFPRRALCSCSMAKAFSAADDRNPSFGGSCVSAYKIGIGSQKTTEGKNIFLS